MPDRKKDDVLPPAIFSDDPEKILEERVNERPDDEDAQVDVGSDESMDASDPNSAVQPGCEDGPVPSSSFPE